MAEVNEQILGKINGKVGKFVFRNVGGKTFVSIRPEKYNVTGTEESTKVKTGFKNLVAFSSFINKVEPLRKVWANKNVKGKRTYNKIFSHNKKFIRSERITEDFLILPNPASYLLHIFGINLEQNQILIEFIDDNDAYRSNEITYQVVLIFYSPAKREFALQLYELDKVELKRRTVESFTLTKENSNFITSSPNCIIYSGLIAKDTANHVSNWSNSVGIISD